MQPPVNDDVRVELNQEETRLVLTKHSGPEEVVLEEIKEAPEFKGNLIEWLKINHPEVLRDPQSIASISGQLQKEPDDYHIAAEIYTRKFKAKNGKVIESNHLKSHIVWEVKLNNGETLRMKEPYLSRVEYPSKNAVKRFALWANVYVATMKLPLLGNEKAFARINEFATGNMTFSLLNASQMTDHTVVSVFLGDNKKEFEINLTDNVNNVALNSLRPREENEGLHPSVNVRDGVEVLREKIFREADLIVVRDNEKRAQNEEVVKFSTLENADEDHIEGMLQKENITPQVYIEHLHGIIKDREGEYYRFSRFLTNANPTWKSGPIKDYFANRFLDLWRNLNAIQREKNRHIQDKKELERLIQKEEILKEEIRHEVKLLERAKSNLNHMIGVKETLVRMHNHVEKLESSNPNLVRTEELKLHLSDVNEKMERQINTLTNELQRVQIPQEIKEILKSQDAGANVGEFHLDELSDEDSGIQIISLEDSDEIQNDRRQINIDI